MDRKPLLVFDGDCGFCRRWIWRWKALTGNKVDYAPFQEAAGSFPGIPRQRFKEAVQLIDPDGRHYGGAQAVFRTLAYAGTKWPLWLYQNLYGFARLSERSYQFIANRRPIFSQLTLWLHGPDLRPSSYVLARWLFVRLIALIYVIAFVSLWTQVDGLMGENGILPAKNFVEVVARHVGLSRYWYLPTLFWLHPGDRMLHWLCAAGTLVSVGALLGIAQGPLLLMAWACYLSLASVGQIFLSFQWDTLLLEAGFLTVFFSSWKLRDRLSAQTEPPKLFLWLLRWLLFRLMFESGCVKLLSGDPRWRDLTALAYHYETQCLPTWIGWYAHQLPLWFQKLSVLAVFSTELFAPFLIFAPRRARMLGAGVMVVFQLLIEATGNYCFFNWLTIGLCLLLLDDAYCQRLFPRRARFKIKKEDVLFSKPLKIAGRVVAAIVIAVSASEMLLMFGCSAPPALALAGLAEPLRTVNNYGLFAVMTVVRDEIVLEGSQDGVTWKDYEFKWKPGDVRKRPAFVAPYQPRLDWQMWFAALGSYRENLWTVSLMARLIQGSRPVLDLLGKDPFPGRPPQYMRAALYEYHFTDFKHRRADGAWWSREPKGFYMPVISRKMLQEAGG